MSLSSNNWFKYINEMRLNEGVRDIGLPEVVIDRIEDTLSDSSEKAKMWMGQRWKARKLNNPLWQTEIVMKILGILIRTGVLDGDDSLEAQEEDSENVRKVKFQIQNANQITKNAPLGKWKKGFQKIFRNLSEAGVPSEAVEEIQEAINQQLIGSFEMMFSRAQILFTMLNLDPTYYEEIKDFTEEEHGAHALSDANTRAEEVMSEVEIPDQIVMQFEDGSYWYDLQTSSCDIEASRMGHCGGDSRANTLFSLRRKSKNWKASKSYVTFAYSEHEDAAYQIKGRANEAPHEWAWPHIKDLIEQLGITTVYESGEHSNDPEGFTAFLAYLKENTDATVVDNSEVLWDEMYERLEGIEHNAFDPDDIEGIGIVRGYGYDMVDLHDLEGGAEPYYTSWATIQLEISLGWPDVELSEGEYKSPGFTPIPQDSWGADGVDEFVESLGLDELARDIPEIGWSNEMPHIDYIVKMVGGASGERTAHLVVEIQTHNERSTDTTDYRNFLDSLEEMNEQSNSDEVYARVRTALVEGDYAEPTPWDRSKKAILDLEDDRELKNFVIVDDPVSIDFIFKDPETKTTAIRSELVLPATLLPYMEIGTPEAPALYHDAGERAFLTLTARIFEAQPNPSFRYAFNSSVLNSHMYQQLNYLYRQHQRAQHDPRQQELPLGHRYRRQTTPLPQGVQVEMRIKPIQVESALSFEYTFKIIVSNRSSQEEIDQTIDFVKVLGANPEFVTAAAEEVLDLKASAALHDAKQRQEKYNDPQHFQNLYAGMDRAWAAEADKGSNYAEAIVLMLMWFRDNYNDMDSVAKLIAIHDYMEPWSLGQMSPRNTTAPRPLAYHEEERNLGKPVGFDQKVRVRTRAMGGHAPEHGLQREGIETLTRSIRSARMKESPEERFARLDELLNEADPNYDLRIYKITVGCNVSDEVGGSEAETAAEIRGINGVTTVRPIADFKKRITAQNEYIPFEIKFELVGDVSRVKYRDQLLFPGMRLIKGLNIVDWTSIHRTNVQGTVHTVRESADGMGGNFGGLGGMLGASAGRAYATEPRATPTPTIDELISDWREGGVQMYDHPTDTTNMAYHVMMPVKELWQYASTYYRGDQLSFDGNYQDFIKNGAQNPVYLAVGKNGRASITGGEDIIWFAKKSGLEEVPVFISYQRQV